METKTYFASSIQAAMDVARRELGPDAMLVNSGPSPESVRQFGRLEVTFAWEPSGAGVARSAGAARSVGEARSAGAASGSTEAVLRPAETIYAPPTGAGRRGETGLEDIRREISALRAAFGRQATGATATGSAGAEPVVAIDEDAVQTLCETGMNKDTARQVVVAASKGSGRIGEGIVRELTARIPVAEFAPLQAEESRTVAFVGPAGRGKTTSLIKVALRYGLAHRIPTRIYTAGAHGVGATEQMARYASILGVPFQAVESFEGLGLALHGDRWKGLVLIDTPGAVGGDRQEMDAMAKFFSRRREIERHLVLRAEAHSADMQYMLSRFAAIQPSRLLFTGVDEVRGLGAAADTMIRSGIAATFFGTGPQIPEDLEEVNAGKLARSLWTVNGLAAKAA